MKTTIKQLAAGTFIALLLVVGNVRAEGTETKASGHEAAIETSLLLEAWMTDEDIWNVSTVDFSEIMQETDMQLESWMTNEKTWSLNPYSYPENEPVLEVENWMTDNEIWNGNENNQEKDNMLNVEKWMTSYNVWK